MNHTCDDLHAWLAPFTRGRDHLIYIDFDEVSVNHVLLFNY